MSYKSIWIYVNFGKREESIIKSGRNSIARMAIPEGGLTNAQQYRRLVNFGEEQKANLSSGRNK